MLAYLSLFATAFLAATVLPLQSEFHLAALLHGGEHDTATLLAFATAGNTLGSVANWLLGRFFSHYRDRRWFPLKGEHFDKAVGWYRRWGFWSLLLSWAPFVGDPLTIAAGVLRADLRRFVAVVALAKGGRYLLVAAAMQPYL